MIRKSTLLNLLTHFHLVPLNSSLISKSGTWFLLSKMFMNIDGTGAVYSKKYSLCVGFRSCLFQWSFCVGSRSCLFPTGDKRPWIVGVEVVIIIRGALMADDGRRRLVIARIAWFDYVCFIVPNCVIDVLQREVMSKRIAFCRLLLCLP